MRKIFYGRAAVARYVFNDELRTPVIRNARRRGRRDRRRAAIGRASQVVTSLT